MADGFSISKDSIQIPYSRFLTESAAGLLLILLSIAAYYLPLVTHEPLRMSPLFSSGSMPGPEIKIFVLVVAFLLATPLGYAINGFSWTIMTQGIVYIETLCFRRGIAGDSSFFPASYVSEARHVATLAQIGRASCRERV